MYVTISLFIIVKKVASLFQISGEREELSEMKVLEASYKGRWSLETTFLIPASG
jgi:hypothetical protein